MKRKMIKFSLMNVLIKGTAEAIQKALNKLGLYTYKLKKSTYNPEKVEISNTEILTAGLIFEEYCDNFITPEEVPFADIPDIKFIGLGNGGDGKRIDGTYVFYKDFGETSISECYQFSPFNPQREEFDAQWKVVDKVHNSFMDHEWKYKFKNYSCGEYCDWAFNGEEDKKLISKWKSDEKKEVIEEEVFVEQERKTDNRQMKTDTIKQGNDTKGKQNIYKNEVVSDGISAFEIKDNVLIKYRGAEKKIIIPDNINAIGDNAFRGCKDLKTIRLPETVKKIGKAAFNGCGGLKDINMNNCNIESIGDYAFCACRSLKEITIPESVKHIGHDAFSLCCRIKNVMIPKGVVEIEDNTFYGCSSLEEVNIQGDVKKIGANVFWNCKKISKINIPSSVKEIGHEAFDNCISLELINIPEGIEKIEYCSFSNCKKLKELSLPESVKYIEFKAFEGCAELSDFIIPKNVVMIDNKAFMGCKGIKMIKIPIGAKRLGDCIFKNCSSLTDIFIPNTIEEMWGDILGGLTNNVCVHVESNSDIKDRIKKSPKVMYIEDYTA